MEKEKLLLNYKDNKDWAENIAIIAQLGLTMSGSILFCLFVGLWLDKLLNLSYILTFIFTVLGVIGGANVCYRQIISITSYKKKG